MDENKTPKIKPMNKICITYMVSAIWGKNARESAKQKVNILANRVL